MPPTLKGDDEDDGGDDGDDGGDDGDDDDGDVDDDGDHGALRIPHGRGAV